MSEGYRSRGWQSARWPVTNHLHGDETPEGSTRDPLWMACRAFGRFRTSRICSGPSGSLLEPGLRLGPVADDRVQRRSPAGPRHTCSLTCWPGGSALIRLMRWFSLRIGTPSTCRITSLRLQPGRRGRRVGVDRHRPAPPAPGPGPSFDGVGRLERLAPAARPGSRGSRCPCPAACSATRLTRLIGMLKATPLLLPLCEAMAVLMPMTSPSRLTSGPPLEPGLMAASVCRKSLMRIVLPRLTWPRSRALMMPCVTVWFRPNGTAERQHPAGRRAALSLSPSVAVGRSSSPSRRSTAMSDSGSAQTCVGWRMPAVGQVDGDLLGRGLADDVVVGQRRRSRGRPSIRTGRRSRSHRPAGFAFLDRRLDGLEGDDGGGHLARRRPRSGR